jgi:hypothetical protein
MQEKLVAFGIIKKPDSERERPREEVAKRQQEVARLSRRYDRKALYDQVWSQLTSPSPPDGPTNCIPRARERKEARHEVPPHHRVRRGCSARLCRSQLGHRVDGGARAAEEPF